MLDLDPKFQSKLHFLEALIVTYGLMDHLCGFLEFRIFHCFSNDVIVAS